MNAADRGTVVHVYGMVDATCSVRPPDGVAGAGVYLERLGDSAVLVSELPEDAYGEQVWHRHAEDPEWLGRVAGEHHAVLQAVVQEADVLPLRLPGIYPDLWVVEQVLDGQEQDLVAAFARVRGHVEMGAKAFVAAGVAQNGDEGRPASGREYLRRRAEEATNHERALSRRQSRLLDAHEMLAQCATRAVANPPQDAAISGRPEPMALNGAYLVARDRVDEFVEAAGHLDGQLAADALALEVTGPWPPYNFAAGAGPATDEHVEAVGRGEGR